MCPESIPAVPLLSKYKHITGSEQVETQLSWKESRKASPSSTWALMSSFRKSDHPLELLSCPLGTFLPFSSKSPSALFRLHSKFSRGGKLLQDLLHMKEGVSSTVDSSGQLDFIIYNYKCGTVLTWGRGVTHSRTMKQSKARPIDYFIHLDLF